MKRILLALVAVGALFIGNNVALGATFDPGDDRARVVDPAPKDCAGAGLEGDIITGELKFSGNFDPDRYLGEFVTVMSVQEGYEFTGAVVKGGPAANVYEMTDLPATDLHAPLTVKGKIHPIIKVFLCGTKTPTPQPTETPTPTPTPPAPPAPLPDTGA